MHCVSDLKYACSRRNEATAEFLRITVTPRRKACYLLLCPHIIDLTRNITLIIVSLGMEGVPPPPPKTNEQSKKDAI